MITLLVKELGVKYIIAKGQSDLHAKVLYKIGADRVVLPEKDMGVRVAHNLVSASILDFIELSPNYSIMELRVLNEWSGKTLNELKLRSRYGINIMAIKRGEDSLFMASISDKITGIVPASLEAIYYRRLRIGSASRSEESKYSRLTRKARLIASYMKVYISGVSGYNPILFLTRILATIRN